MDFNVLTGDRCTSQSSGSISMAGRSTERQRRNPVRGQMIDIGVVGKIITMTGIAGTASIIRSCASDRHGNYQAAGGWIDQGTTRIVAAGAAIMDFGIVRINRITGGGMTSYTIVMVLDHI